MNSTADTKIIDSTKNIKSFIYSLGIDIVGTAELSELGNIPVGLNINLSDLVPCIICSAAAKLATTHYLLKCVSMQ